MAIDPFTRTSGEKQRFKRRLTRRIRKEAVELFIEETDWEPQVLQPFGEDSIRLEGRRIFASAEAPGLVIEITVHVRWPDDAEEGK